MGVEFAKTPEDKKESELELDKAQERLDEIRSQYDQAVSERDDAEYGRAAGLKPTESVTSATLGKKSMGKGRKKKRTIRKKRSQKKRTLRR